MASYLSPTRYGDPVVVPQHVPQDPQSAARQPPQSSTPAQDQEEMTQRSSRIQSLRRSVTGLFTFSPRRHPPSPVSDNAPTFPPLSFSGNDPSPPEPAHIRAARSPTPDPATVPLPATATPLLFGETTLNSPTAPYAHEQNPRTPQRRSLLDKLICPNPHQHNLATLLIDSAERRQKHAWVRRPRPAAAPRTRSYDVSSPAPLLPQQHHHHHQHRPRNTLTKHRHRAHRHSGSRRRRHTNRLVRAAVFGVLLVALLATYLALALTQDGMYGHALLPAAVHAVFVLLIIAATVAFLHAFIRTVCLRRSSRGRGRARRHHHHGHRRRSRPRPLDLEGAMPADHIAGQLQPRAIHTDDEGHSDIDSDDEGERDANALPHDDTLYTPTSPIRVHLIADPAPLTKEPAVTHAPVVVSPTGTRVSFAMPSESPVALPSPAAQHFGLRSPGQTAAPSPVRVENAPTQQITSPTRQSPRRDNEGHTPADDASGLVAPAVPPSYGEWRCSVRADPALLFWRRVTPESSPAQPRSPVYYPQTPAQLHHPQTTPQHGDPTTSDPGHTPLAEHTRFFAGQAPPAQTTTAVTAPTEITSVTAPTAPPAYSAIHAPPRAYAITVQPAREFATPTRPAPQDLADDWHLTPGFGGQRMDEGVQVVLPDLVGVVRGNGMTGRRNAESGQSGNGDVAGLTRELLRAASEEGDVVEGRGRVVE